MIDERIRPKQYNEKRQPMKMMKFLFSCQICCFNLYIQRKLEHFRLKSLKMCSLWFILIVMMTTMVTISEGRCRKTFSGKKYLLSIG